MILRNKYENEDNWSIRDDAIVLQIPMVGPRLPFTDICYRPLIPHQCNYYRPNRAFLSVDSYLFKIATPIYTETSRCDYPLPITINSFLCSITEIQ